MAGRDLEPRMFIPDQRYWLVGPTYDLGEKEFRVMWNDLIVKLKLGADKRVSKAYNKKGGDMHIALPNRTVLEVRSAQHPDTLVGDELDHVIMCEAAKHRDDTFDKYIRAALADRRGTADFPSTPEGLNWYYDMYMLGLNDAHPDFESWHFPSWENPIVYPGGRQDTEILAIERTVAKEFFDQEIAAKFTTFVGRIYGDFDPTIHVQNHTFHPEWPNYISFDWGYVHPLAAIEFQISPSDVMYIWREHYKSHLTVAEHCRLLKEREQPPGYHLDVGFGDAADPEAAAVVSQHLVNCMTDPMAKSNWREGVDLVTSLMQEHETGNFLDEYGTPELKPHFFVDPSCEHTIREHQNYRRKETAANSKESGQTAPTTKQDEHTCDAVRYGAMHVFKLGAQHHLADVEEMPSGLVVVQHQPQTAPQYEGLGVFSAEDEEYVNSNGSTFFNLKETVF